MSAGRAANATAAGDGTALESPLAPPAPAAAFKAGGVALRRDRSLWIEGASDAVWRFAISGHPVLQRRLRARVDEALDSALLREASDVVWRIEELIALAGEADTILARAVGASLTRADLGLMPRDAATSGAEDDDDTS